jgi:hypothetical protein
MTISGTPSRAAGGDQMHNSGPTGSGKGGRRREVAADEDRAAAGVEVSLSERDRRRPAVSSTTVHMTRS